MRVKCTIFLHIVCSSERISISLMNRESISPMGIRQSLFTPPKKSLVLDTDNSKLSRQLICLRSICRSQKLRTTEVQNRKKMIGRNYFLENWDFCKIIHVRVSLMWKYQINGSPYDVIGAIKVAVVAHTHFFF